MLIWKFGLPSSTAIEYSAIFLLSTSLELSSTETIASNGQEPMHLPQPAHLSLSMTAFLSIMEMASWAQFFLHVPHPTHFFSLTLGPLEECISIFPAREPLPIPMFLRAPPNPVSSCPLKCVRDMIISASIISFPIMAFSQSSPFLTGTYTSLSPLRPSPIIILHPVEKGVNPFSYAASICSRAFFLLPT